MSFTNTLFAIPNTAKDSVTNNDAIDSFNSFLSETFLGESPDAGGTLGDPSPRKQMEVGVYNDLAPGFVMDNTGQHIGTRAILSKRHRDDYGRTAFMYFSIQDKDKIIKALEGRMDETAKAEFEKVFGLGSKGANAKDYSFSGRFSTEKTISTGGASQGAFVRFMLTNVDEGFQEKYQLVDLLQDSYVPYFYGTAPTIFRFSGFLVNSVHDQWKYWFLTLWHKVIKASRLAELPGSPVLRIYYEDTLVAGYPIGLNISHDVNDDSILQFSMEFLVKEYTVQRDDNSSYDFASEFIYDPDPPYVSINELISKKAQQVTGSTAAENVVLDAIGDFVTDAVNDLVGEIGGEALASTINDALGSNLNPANLADNLQKDPINTIRSIPGQVSDSKAGLINSKNSFKDAKANPNKVKEFTIKDNIILGKFE